MKELNKYSFHIKVKEKVSELAKKLKLEQRKGKLKKRLYYFYIIAAYAELGWVCDPKRIQEELKLSQKDVNSSEAEYSEVQINYVPPELPDTPETFMINYLEELGIGYDYYENILKFYEDLRTRDVEFTDKYFPQDICLSLIIKFLNDNGYQFKLKDTCNTFSRKETKIKEVIKYIERIENL